MDSSQIYKTLPILKAKNKGTRQIRLIYIKISFIELVALPYGEEAELAIDIVNNLGGW